MLKVRYEEYEDLGEKSPCRVYPDVNKNSGNLSEQMNWHENLELQIIHSGKGAVLLDGESYEIHKNSIVVVNSNVLHYNLTSDSINYSAIIVNSKFCRNLGLNFDLLRFSPIIEDEKLSALLCELKELWNNKEVGLKTARLHQKMAGALIYLIENYSAENNAVRNNTQSFERVKAAIKYIRENYAAKITLDSIAGSIYADKFVLTREFKRITGKTVVEYINAYRCNRAAILISEGATVTEAAFECGFNNLSFFSKTFKGFIGKLPSQMK